MSADDRKNPLAKWLTKNNHRPMLVSVDVYRPAAREQLKVIAREIGVKIWDGEPGEKPLALCEGALSEVMNTGHDVLLIDTAGRLHIDEELMKELTEIKEKFRPHEIGLEERVCHHQPTTIVAVKQVMAARNPEIPHSRFNSARICAKSTSSCGCSSSSTSRNESTRNGLGPPRGRKVRNDSRTSPLSDSRWTAISVSRGLSQSDSEKVTSSSAATRAVSKAGAPSLSTSCRASRSTTARRSC